MSSVRLADEPREPFFTVETLAGYLQLSTRTVERMLVDGEIPSYKIARRRRIDAGDVDRYLASHRQKKAA